MRSWALAALAAAALTTPVIAADGTTALPKLTSGGTTTTTKGTTAGTTATTVLPGLTTTSALPKLPTSTATSATYSYPAPSVPPTSNAPFMQKSTLPEGTVFIAVGAILGAFGAAVLIWRAVVACLLHRSVKRAALAQQLATDKAGFPPPTAPFYKYTDQGSTISMGAGATAGVPGRGVRRTTRGPIPSATPSQSNLFFSPTAPGANSATNRSSQFLPSGFYAAGSGAASQQDHGPSISLTDLRPNSRDQRPGSRDQLRQAMRPSPPESPSMTPRTDPTRRNLNLSTSTINLNQPPTGRAPSAFLDDLLDENPGQFPPAHHSQTWNHPSNRS